MQLFCFWDLIVITRYWFVSVRAGEPERPEPHDLAGAILFFLQEPEHFQKLEWSRSWHKLVRSMLQQFLKIFIKNNDF